MKRTFFLALLITALLLGCGKEQQEVPSVPVESTAPSVATEQPTVPPTSQPATEPEVKPCNPLTGEALSEPMYTRPYAVMFNNIPAALPQCGVGEADWLFEVVVEGGITRCMGLFTQLPQNGSMGSIRSARLYYVQLAQGYDAIYVHAGGSDEAYTALSQTGQDHIDGVNGANAAAWFYRNQERLNAGVALEHTMFITSQDAESYAKEEKCAFTRQEPTSYGLSFAEDGVPAGKAAKAVTVWFRSGGKTTSFQYDDATGCYGASEYGKDYIDGNTGKTLEFRNILVLQAETTTHDNGYLQVIDLLGSGEGSFACGGKCVDIRWSRESQDDPFTLTLADGTLLTLGIGKTYVGIVPTGSPLDLEA